VADDDRFSSWGLCLAMLAFVGDAKDGLCGSTWVVSWRIGIRLGVPGASTDTDVLGEVLRRFAGEDSIGRNAGRFYQPAIRRRWGIAESTQSFGKIPESDKAGNASRTSPRDLRGRGVSRRFVGLVRCSVWTLRQIAENAKI
jgi:hypothetical protein